MTRNSYHFNNSSAPLQQKLRKQSLLLLLLLPLFGCGYTLKGTHNTFYDKTGVQKIYIAPIINKTYKAGIETYIYGSLMKTINANHQLTVVQSPKLADAILKVTITAANYIGMSGSQAYQLSPGTTSSSPPGTVQLLGAVSGFQINNIYNATLTCMFSVVAAKTLKPPQIKPEVITPELPETEETAPTTGPLESLEPEEIIKPKIITTLKNKILWTTSLSRSEPFQSANQLDVPGTTSALINESMFERALSDLSTIIANDAHSLMMNIF